MVYNPNFDPPPPSGNERILTDAPRGYLTALQIAETGVILKTVAQIASPTAGMLADLKATYQLNVAPNTRYYSDGSALISLDGAEIWANTAHDEITGADGAITTATTSFSSASAAFAASDRGKAIVVNGAGAAAADLVTTIASVTSATAVVLSAAAGTTVSGATYAYGTDDTTAINAAIAKAMVSGGPATVRLPPGTSLMLGAFVLSYTASGVNNPVQYPLRLTGAAASVDGSLGNGVHGAVTTVGGTIIDNRYDGVDALHVAKIDTRGFGTLEIDHLKLIDGGTSNFLFLQTTNTKLNLHDLAIIGNAANSGTACTQNAIQFGGITSGSSTLATSAATAGFQGYGTVVRDVSFSHIKTAFGFGGSANGIYISNAIVDITCGSADAQGAAYVFYGVGLGAQGNTVSGGVIEVAHYPYGVAILGTVANNLNNFLGLGMYDETMAAPTLGPYYFSATSTDNAVFGGYISSVLGATFASGAGAASNTWIVPNTRGNNILGITSVTSGLASAGATASTSYVLDSGDGTGQRIVRINGAASGSNGGAAIYFAHGSSTVSELGTYSAVRGGAFDARCLLTSSSGVVIGFGNNNVMQTGVTGLQMLSGQYFAGTVDNALTAAGTTRADGLALGAQTNNITTAGANTGVVLPAVSAVTVGSILIVFNAGANAVKVYATGSDTIDGVAGATGVPLTNAKRCMFIAVAPATWVSAQLGVVSA